MNEARAWAVLGSVAALAVAATFLFLPPIPQSASYHEFADRSALLGIPHSLDVRSQMRVCEPVGQQVERFQDRQPGAANFSEESEKNDCSGIVRVDAGHLGKREQDSVVSGSPDDLG